jgi:4-hydroxy-4-methyl-2-oxoglutarate aldolase
MSGLEKKFADAIAAASKELDPKMLAEYSKLYTPAVSDAIDNLKLRPGFMDMGIKPMWPGARFVGYAATIEFVPGDTFNEGDVQSLMSMLSKVGKHRAVVMSMSGMNIASGLGQVTSMIAQKLGCTGGVVDGPVRDLAQVNALKFPLFGRGCIPSSVRGRMKLGSLISPVKCGGVLVNPGDLVFGDINGVVVAPEHALREVLEESKKIISADNFWQEQMKKGRSPADIEKEVPLP